MWGEQAEVFDPDNFSREAERQRPANAYKPFGNGQRACIGRQFALQEAALVLGMILQRFKLIDHTRYQLKIKETLTIKPDGSASRSGRAPTARQRSRRRRSPATAPVQDEERRAEPAAGGAGHRTPLLVLYGSNLGTAEGLARQIAEDGAAQGFAATVAPLDEYAGKSADGRGRGRSSPRPTTARRPTTPAASATGCATARSDRTRSTASATRSSAAATATGRRPTRRSQADRRRARGARGRRVYPRGEGDARDDFDGQFRAWYEHLWNSLAGALGTSWGARCHRQGAALRGRARHGTVEASPSSPSTAQGRWR